MPTGERRQYLVCYDIADPQRLTRVHRLLARHAAPVQYSVFLAYATVAELRELLTEVEGVIDPRADDVRAYPLPSQPRAIGFGRSWFPPGVMLVENGRDLLRPGDDGQPL
jgi:CRISPR-associated protein Cas2